MASVMLFFSGNLAQTMDDTDDNYIFPWKCLWKTLNFRYFFCGILQPFSRNSGWDSSVFHSGVWTKNGMAHYRLSMTVATLTAPKKPSILSILGSDVSTHKLLWILCCLVVLFGAIAVAALVFAALAYFKSTDSTNTTTVNNITSTVTSGIQCLTVFHNLSWVRTIKISEGRIIVQRENLMPLYI